MRAALHGGVMSDPDWGAVGGGGGGGRGREVGLGMGWRRLRKRDAGGWNGGAKCGKGAPRRNGIRGSSFDSRCCRFNPSRTRTPRCAVALGVCPF